MVYGVWCMVYGKRYIGYSVCLGGVLHRWNSLVRQHLLIERPLYVRQYSTFCEDIIPIDHLDYI